MATAATILAINMWQKKGLLRSALPTAIAILHQVGQSYIPKQYQPLYHLACCVLLGSSSKWHGTAKTTLFATVVLAVKILYPLLTQSSPPRPANRSRVPSSPASLEDAAGSSFDKVAARIPTVVGAFRPDFTGEIERAPSEMLEARQEDIDKPFHVITDNLCIGGAALTSYIVGEGEGARLEKTISLESLNLINKDEWQETQRANGMQVEESLGLRKLPDLIIVLAEPEGRNPSIREQREKLYAEAGFKDGKTNPCKGLNICYVPLLDKADGFSKMLELQSDLFPRMDEIIENKGVICIVCNGGAHRSVAFAMRYLIERSRDTTSLFSIWRFIRNKRSVANQINRGLIGEVFKYYAMDKSRRIGIKDIDWNNGDICRETSSGEPSFQTALTTLAKNNGEI